MGAILSLTFIEYVAYTCNTTFGRVVLLFLVSKTLLEVGNLLFQLLDLIIFFLEFVPIRRFNENR